MIQKARVVVFTGNGKGKTTAAFGMALRAAGHGLKVAIVQFIKADPTVGEYRMVSQLPGVTILQSGRGFLPPPGDPAFAEHQAAARQGLRQARDLVASGQVALVILDEICLAVTRGLLKEPEVLEIVNGACPGSCIVMTGRGASEGILAAADTVTEMQEVKHGFRAGIPAQPGVEW